MNKNTDSWVCWDEDGAVSARVERFRQAPGTRSLDALEHRIDALMERLHGLYIDVAEARASVRGRRG